MRQQGNFICTHIQKKLIYITFSTDVNSKKKGRERANILFECISGQSCKKPPSGTEYLHEANGWVEINSPKMDHLNRGTKFSRLPVILVSMRVIMVDGRTSQGKKVVGYFSLYPTKKQRSGRTGKAKEGKSAFANRV
jgi:hypothetical protein